MEEPSFEENYYQYRGLIESLFAELGEEKYDLCQEVFLRAWIHRGRYDPNKGTYITWLSTIALNRKRDYFRRKRWETSLSALPDDKKDQIEALTDPFSIEEEVEVTEIRGQVRDSISRLPNENQRTALFLSLQDFTGEEIARQLGACASTSRSYLLRGRRAMSEDPVLLAWVQEESFGI